MAAGVAGGAQGLEGLTSETVYVIRREHEGGAREYPMFLITARKPD